LFKVSSRLLCISIKGGKENEEGKNKQGNFREQGFEILILFLVPTRQRWKHIHDALASEFVKMGTLVRPDWVPRWRVTAIKLRAFAVVGPYENPCYYGDVGANRRVRPSLT